MKLKKLLAVILSVIILIGVLPFGAITASAATSGTTGDCTWKLDGTVLTISGNGKMGGYVATKPWGTSITDVIIENGVINIGEGAFMGYVSLTRITIGDSVTSIAGSAFSKCTSLKSITVNSNNSNYTSLDGILFNKNKTKLILYPAGKTNTLYSILDGVTSIGSSAFSDCTSLTSITIPDSVTSIGDFAFYGCTSLTSVTIPNSVTSIGSSAFCRCTSLTSITIPDSVTSIGSSAFYDCTSLTSITIPDNVTSIGSSAFSGCTSLTSITIPDSVTSIGERAFNHCTSFTSITIPDSVKSIGSEAFYGCNNLKNVYLTSIEKWFAITLGDEYSNPMYYAENLYVNNLLLTDLYIPEDAQIIETNKFYGFASVKNVFIPKSVVLIKQNAFNGCESIKNIYFEGTSEEWANVTILSGNDYLKNATVYFNCTGIPGGITSVEISKLPNKLQYIENKESLDLAGGVLTVNYDGGATLDIDLATLNAEGFDNSILGKQKITVKYGEFSATFEIEVITRPIAFFAISTFPTKREYKTGEPLDLTGGKFVVGYPEGNYEIFDLTADMVSGYDMNKSGIQILTVTYKGYKTEFAITVIKNGDINGDNIFNANDIVVLRKQLLNNSEYKKSADINNDGVLDIRDLICLKQMLIE